jgi:hypothetical protein
MKLHRRAARKHSRIFVSSTAESLSVVKGDEVVVMFVTVDGEILQETFQKVIKLYKFGFRKKKCWKK